MVPLFATARPSPVSLAPLFGANFRPVAAPRSAVAYEADVEGSEESLAPGRALRSLDADDVTEEAVVCRVVVPHFETKPGQQLFLSGSVPSLGEWEADAAVPLEWQEGHKHVAVVPLPPSKLVQAKVVLMENGRLAFTEEGSPRDIMLMPVKGSAKGSSSSKSLSGGESSDEERLAASLAPSAARSSAEAVDYQIMCHFGNPEATQILRLPIVLPAKDPSDRRVLSKFVVLLDSLKLEPRHYPVVVGNVEELGAWDATKGVKLMRQVGGYWTRRAELPLYSDIQAKVVICNPEGQPVLWEPGTSNRVLAAPRDVAGAPATAMHVFVCRWSTPAHTPVVSVPVEHEDPSKEYVKQLDAAQREIGLMRQAVTAKSRQVQALESDLAASRRAERMLREELNGMRAELDVLAQEVEVAQRGELEARKEAAAMRSELTRLGETYEQQVSFLESTLVAMEHEIADLRSRVMGGGANGHNGHGNGNNGNHGGERVMTRSSWR